MKPNVKRQQAIEAKLKLIPKVKVGKANYDLTGKRFGRLVALELSDPTGPMAYLSLWTCRCDCGVISSKRCHLLLNGITTSCGCARKALRGKVRGVKHGMARTKIYAEWFKVTVISQQRVSPLPVERTWIDNLPAFITDVGMPPSYHHTLLRDVNALGWVKENVRWMVSDRIQQSSIDRWIKADSVAAEVLQDITRYQGRQEKKKSDYAVVTNHSRRSLEGERYGKLVVDKFLRLNKHQNRIWQCRCDCGNIVEKGTSYLTTARQPSCGCASLELQEIFEDLTGRVFGNLTVLGLAGKRKNKKSSGSTTAWKCQCACGNQTVISRAGLITAGTVSCGCYQREVSTTHDESQTVEYAAWMGINKCCHNPKNPNFKRRQANGITVCDRWRESVLNFIEDMGRRPDHCIALERYDRSKGYYKENCYWREPSKKYKYSKKRRPSTPPKFDQVVFDNDVGIVRAGSTRPNATESN